MVLRFLLLLASLLGFYLVGVLEPGYPDLLGLVLLLSSAALWHRTMHRAADAWVRRRGVERFKRAVDSMVAVSTFAWLGIGLFVMLTPRFEATYDKAYIAAMKSDLRRLSGAQQARLREGLPYASALHQLSDVRLSSDVSIAVESTASSGGRALAGHTFSRTSCAVAWGDAVNPIDSTVASGVPICRAKYRWRTVLR